MLRSGGPGSSKMVLLFHRYDALLLGVQPPGEHGCAGSRGPGLPHGHRRRCTEAPISRLRGALEPDGGRAAADGVRAESPRDRPARLPRRRRPDDRIRRQSGTAHRRWRGPVSPPSTRCETRVARPPTIARSGGIPTVKKVQELTKLLVSRPGVDKLAVIMNVVSNTRSDLVARGVIKGMVEADRNPAETVCRISPPRSRGGGVPEDSGPLRRPLSAGGKSPLTKPPPWRWHGRKQQPDIESDGNTDRSEHCDSGPRHHRAGSQFLHPRVSRLRRPGRGRSDARKRRPGGLRGPPSTTVSGTPFATTAINAGVVSVPPFAVRDAALEAVENGIRLLVIMTERVPRRDVAALLECRT